MKQKDYDITRQANRDTKLSDDWLRRNGLASASFATTKLEIVRAQAMAHTLLTQNFDLLSKRQIHALTDFQAAAANKRESKTLTPAFCHCVMNISANINRKLFKQYRKLNR